MPIATGQSYDLSDLERVDRLYKKFGLYLTLAIALGLAAEWAALIAPILPALARQTASSMQFVVAIYITGISWTVVIVAALTLPADFAGASAIQITDEGIQVCYANSKQRALPWSSSHTRFELRDFSEYPRMLRQRRGYHIYTPILTGAWIFHRRSVITREAFEGVLSAAQRGGARITTFKGSRFPNGFRPMVHRVRGAGSTLLAA